MPLTMPKVMVPPGIEPGIFALLLGVSYKCDALPLSHKTEAWLALRARADVGEEFWAFL